MEAALLTQISLALAAKTGRPELSKKEFRNVSSCFPRRGSPLPNQSGWSWLFVFIPPAPSIMFGRCFLTQRLRVNLFPPMQTDAILRDLRPFPSLSLTV